METLESIGRRIAVTEDLDAVVRTMKSLAVASVRHFEQAVAAVNAYHRTVEMGLCRVLADVGRRGSRRRGSRRLGAVVLGSDQGLCGRFNDDVVQHALLALRASGAAPADRFVLAVGARAAARLEHAGVVPGRTLAAPASVAALTSAAERVLLAVQTWRTEAGVEEVLLLYNRAAAAGGHRPHTRHLLPVDPQRFERPREAIWPTRALPLYTMPAAELLAALLRQYFFVAVFRALAESAAAEHAARLAAMQGAARNIEERLGELRAAWQHRRQEVITEELLDIVNGFEATTPAPGRSGAAQNSV